jgi:hypothetical protein
MVVTPAEHLIRKLVMPAVKVMRFKHVRSKVSSDGRAVVKRTNGHVNFDMLT